MVTIEMIATRRFNRSGGQKLKPGDPFTCTKSQGQTYQRLGMARMQGDVAAEILHANKMDNRHVTKPVGSPAHPSSAGGSDLQSSASPPAHPSVQATLNSSGGGEIPRVTRRRKSRVLAGT